MNTFWEIQYNDSSAQSHMQLNGCAYSNIYTRNIACNTRSESLKSPKTISHDWRPTTLLLSDFIG